MLVATLSRHFQDTFITRSRHDESAGILDLEFEATEKCGECDMHLDHHSILLHVSHRANVMASPLPSLHRRSLFWYWKDIAR